MALPSIERITGADGEFGVLGEFEASNSPPVAESYPAGYFQSWQASYALSVPGNSSAPSVSNHGSSSSAPCPRFRLEPSPSFATFGEGTRRLPHWHVIQAAARLSAAVIRRWIAQLTIASLACIAAVREKWEGQLTTGDWDLSWLDEKRMFAPWLFLVPRRTSWERSCNENVSPLHVFYLFLAPLIARCVLVSSTFLWLKAAAT